MLGAQVDAQRPANIVQAPRTRRPIFATGTLTSAACESLVGDLVAPAALVPQSSQPPQAPWLLPSTAMLSRCAAARRPRTAGTRAAVRLKPASNLRRRLRGPSDSKAYPTLSSSARHTKEPSRIPFM